MPIQRKYSHRADLLISCHLSHTPEKNPTDMHFSIDFLVFLIHPRPPARLLRRRKQKSLSTHIDLRLRSFHLRRILHFKPFRQATETKNTQKKINNKAMNCKAVNRNLKACKAYQFFLFAVFFTYLLICCVMRVQFRK